MNKSLGATGTLEPRIHFVRAARATGVKFCVFYFTPPEAQTKSSSQYTEKIYRVRLSELKITGTTLPTCHTRHRHHEGIR